MEQSIATILLCGSYSRLQEFEINRSILYHGYQAMYFLVYEPAPHHLIVLSKAPFVSPSSPPIQLALVPARLIRTLIASLVFLHFPAVIQDKSRILEARLPQQHYNILYSYDPWAGRFHVFFLVNQTSRTTRLFITVWLDAQNSHFNCPFSGAMPRISAQASGSIGSCAETPGSECMKMDASTSLQQGEALSDGLQRQTAYFHDGPQAHLRALRLEVRLPSGLREPSDLKRVRICKMSNICCLKLR